MNTLWLVLYNLAFALLLAPLYAGLTRKLRARLHARIGPPVTQPYLDLLKLLGKESTQVSRDLIYRFAPFVTLTGAIAAALFVPLGFPAPFGAAGDGLVLIYLLTLSSAGMVLAGLASHSPYASAGASREMMVLLVVEPVLAAAFFTVSLTTGSLAVGPFTATWSAAVAAIAFLLALQAESAKLPFDIAEAETELMGGPAVEYSGPPLAALQWALMIRQVVLASFFSALFLPWWPYLHPVKVLLVLVMVEVVAVLSPRIKISQAIRFYQGVAALAVIGLFLATLGR
ncbi:MAG TPA: NADH-quinone oxidoreductase subunit H [Symbiobacteriaceae bacterium]|nr:NADH-quinone oxidoreductase subunit H [Symbiobacteriaceae bacterium]